MKQLAEALVKQGFTAGDGYGEVWIRDFNTFMELSCAVNDHALIRAHLLTFLQFQQPDGGILDGYIPVAAAKGGYAYYKSAAAPQYLGHKNTVETDQESSLIQAVAKYIQATGDRQLLATPVGAHSVQARLEQALDFLLQHRYAPQYGLLWGATTADWGDVQPEHSWGVELDAQSHRAIDIYDNAMFVLAIKDFLRIAELDAAKQKRWQAVANQVAKNIRAHLWDKKAQKFKPHLYLNGSPFPPDFDESQVYYHGGTTVAIEADLLSKPEIKTAYEQMQQHIRLAHAATIGLTLYPVYPAGSFKNKGMAPYSYQNGGDWTWFGARMVRALAKAGFVTEAQEALAPMLERVLVNKGFYEWYTPANQPRGSASFRGEAGALWSAINSLPKN